MLNTNNLIVRNDARTVPGEGASGFHDQAMRENTSLNKFLIASHTRPLAQRVSIPGLNRILFEPCSNIQCFGGGGTWDEQTREHTMITKNS
jgi:hypothetical protein